MIKACSFYSSLEGYRVIVCNTPCGNSLVFDSVDSDTYDIMSVFFFDGKQYTVSLYSTKKEIDVSEIAKKHGGGGHKGAAGFQCKELPFKAEGTS